MGQTAPSACHSLSGRSPEYCNGPTLDTRHPPQCTDRRGGSPGRWAGVFGWVCGRVCVGGWVRGWTGRGQNLRKAELSLGLRFQVTSPAQPSPPPPPPPPGVNPRTGRSSCITPESHSLRKPRNERASALCQRCCQGRLPRHSRQPHSSWPFVSCRSSVRDLWNPYFVFRAGRECHACASLPISLIRLPSPSSVIPPRVPGILTSPSYL